MTEQEKINNSVEIIHKMADDILNDFINSIPIFNFIEYESEG